MKVIFIIFSMLLPVVTYAQSITGKLIDAQNQPAPLPMSSHSRPILPLSPELSRTMMVLLK